MTAEARYTPRMRRASASLGEPLESYIQRSYIDQGLSLPQMTPDLSCTPRTISRWMVILNIPRRDPSQTWQTPQIRQRIVEGTRKFWRDPVKKQLALIKVHTPESAKKRGDTVRRNYLDPDLRERIQTKTRESKESNKRARLVYLLGDDPGQTLNWLHNSQLIPIEGISEMLERADTTTRALMRQLGVEPRKKYVKTRTRPLEQRQVYEQALDQGLLSSLSSEAQDILGQAFSEKDLSDAKISVQYGITRQAINNQIKNAIAQLKTLIPRRIHTPESNLKRSTTQLERWQDPDFKQKLTAARSETSAKAFRERTVDLLGEDPRKTLDWLYNVQLVPVESLAGIFDTPSVSYTRALMRKIGVEPVRRRQKNGFKPQEYQIYKRALDEDLLKVLSPTYQDILSQTFQGVNATDTQIAAKLGVTRATISRTRKKAIAKLDLHLSDPKFSRIDTLSNTS